MSASGPVLFPTDLSAAADAGFAHAAFVARALEARLLVFHVASIPVAEYAAWGAGREGEVWDRVEAAARKVLEARARALGTRCEIVVARHAPSAQVLVDLSVLDQIRRTSPDLVVMPTHSRSAVSRFFVGSVTERVVRNAPAPVLALRDPGRAPSPYRTVLVATDLSAASRTVFRTAAALAQRFGSRIAAVHVAGGNGAPPADAEAVRAFLRPDLEASAVRLDEGPAWRAILRAAGEERADLVAIARRGADDAGEAALGGTTDRVLRQASCPVLVG
jgi:nucleotide-binding universal stress UspA family protein